MTAEPSIRDWASVLVEDALVLTPRIRNALRFEGIRTVDELIERTADDLMQIRNLARGSVEQIQKQLGMHGLTLRGGSRVRPKYQRHIVNISKFRITIICDGLAKEAIDLMPAGAVIHQVQQVLGLKGDNGSVYSIRIEELP